MPVHDTGHRDWARGQGDESRLWRDSLGWVEVIQKRQILFATGGRLSLPAPSTEIAPPQDANPAKSGTRRPSPVSSHELRHQFPRRDTSNFLSHG